VAQRRAGERRRALAWWLCASLLACAAPPRTPGDLAAAAIAARGGPLPSFARSSELTVHAGFPGVWRWELAYAVPSRLELRLRTSAETQTLVSDGVTLRTYLGDGLVSSEPAHGSGVAALVSFVALSNLDVLADASQVRTEDAGATELPSGAVRGLRAWLRDFSSCDLRSASPRCALDGLPGGPFTLGFDSKLRLVGLAGPVAVPGLGDGPLEARFEDFRRVGHWWLPFAIHYRFRGAPLVDESVDAWRTDVELPGSSPPSRR